MAEIRSIKDVVRDPLIMALVLVVLTGLLTAVVANYQTSQEGRGSQDARATNQPGTQSLPADTKPQSTQSDFSSTGYYGAKHPSTGNRRNSNTIGDRAKRLNRGCAFRGPSATILGLVVVVLRGKPG